MKSYFHWRDNSNRCGRANYGFNGARSEHNPDEDRRSIIMGDKCQISRYKSENPAASAGPKPGVPEPPVDDLSLS